MDIIAEIISDNADYRKEIRFYTFNNGIITTKAKKEEVREVKEEIYKDF